MLTNFGRQCAILSFRANCFTGARRSIVSRQLMYEEYGDPMKVLKMVTKELPKLKDDQVRYKVIASPINPADINTLQGVYPVRPSLPAVGGMEGVMRVEEVGPKVTQLQVGDLVVPSPADMGLWRTDGVAVERDLLKVPKNLDIVAAATLTVNPPTAYQMLTDFVELKPGDTVLQNGSNSAVGQLVIQLCKEFKVNSVNMIRDGKTDEKETKALLKQLGATEVLTVSEFKANVKKMFSSLPAPRLALNCVSGRETLYMAGCLGERGFLVTYGGLSKQPLQLPTGPFIFKAIQARGYWLTQWHQDPANRQKRLQMLQHLADLIMQGKLIIPDYERVKFDDFRAAIANSIDAHGKKKIFIFE